jgi:hypothetical protein
MSAIGNTEGKLSALADADAAASKLTAEPLKEQFALERAKVGQS